VIYTKTISGISDETVNHGDDMDHTDVDYTEEAIEPRSSFITPLGALLAQ